MVNKQTPAVSKPPPMKRCKGRRPTTSRKLQSVSKTVASLLKCPFLLKGRERLGIGRWVPVERGGREWLTAIDFRVARPSKSSHSCIAVLVLQLPRSCVWALRLAMLEWHRMSCVRAWAHGLPEMFQLRRALTVVACHIDPKFSRWNPSCDAISLLAENNASNSRAAKRGCFKRGGFPIWTCPSFFVLFCPFWDFPDFSGIFPICSGMVRGFSRFALFLFLGLLRAPTRNSPERVRDTIWTFPEKSGKHPGLETPRFGFSQQMQIFGLSFHITRRPQLFITSVCASRDVVWASCQSGSVLARISSHQVTNASCPQNPSRRDRIKNQPDTDQRKGTN